MALQAKVDRDDQVAVGVVGVEDVNRNHVAHVQRLLQLLFHPFDILRGHDAVALYPQVHDDLEIVHLQNFGVADVTAFWLVKLGIVIVEHRTEILQIFLTAICEHAHCIHWTVAPPLT